MIAIDLDREPALIASELVALVRDAERAALVWPAGALLLDPPELMFPPPGGVVVSLLRWIGESDVSFAVRLVQRLESAKTPI